MENIACFCSNVADCFSHLLFSINLLNGDCSSNQENKLKGFYLHDGNKKLLVLLVQVTGIEKSYPLMDVTLR